MILSVTPAPALDATVHLSVLEPGESHRVRPPVIRAGGKGLNVARVLASRGFPVRSLATRGGPSGDRLAQDLAATAAETVWVDVQAPTRTSTAWVEDSGRTTVLNEIAGVLSPAEWDSFDAALAASLEGVSVATVSGSWPQDAGEAPLRATVRRLKAAGVYTIVDTSGPLLLAAAEEGADLLKPNLEELLEATGASDATAGVASLLGLGARSILLSRGEEGMSHHTAQDPVGMHARLDAVLQGNPTGAGDAGVAGWLSVAHAHAHAHAPAEAQPRTAPSAVGRDSSPGVEQEDVLSGEPRECALRTAVAWSASAVQAPLAGELGPDADAFLSRITIH